MYKACIFDLDGTLTNTLDSLTYSTNKTLEEMGLEPITKEQCRSFVGDGARCLLERALRASGDTELKRIEEGMEVYSRIFGENCMYHVRPYDGVVQMLDSLKKKGIKIAVFSNKPHLQAIDVVESTFGRIIIPSTIDVVRIPFPSPDFSTSPIIFKVLPKSRMIGTTITMPKKPYTTDGIPASSSVAAFNGL